MNAYTYCFLSKLLAIGGSLVCYSMTESLWSFLFLIFCASIDGEVKPDKKKR